jgi:hypothetical protein
MEYPLLDAETTELLIVALQAAQHAHLRIDDFETAAEVESIIVLLERILDIGGSA